MRAVKELRREALERLRSGEGVGADSPLGGTSADGANGALVLHREADLLKSSGPGASSTATGVGAIVLAGSGKAAAGESAGKGRPVRSGGILVVSQIITRLLQIGTNPMHNCIVPSYFVLFQFTSHE